MKKAEVPLNPSGTSTFFIHASYTRLREMGLEPTRAYTHKILSLACLPIPALPLNQLRSQLITPLVYHKFFILQLFFEKLTKFVYQYAGTPTGSGFFVQNSDFSFFYSSSILPLRKPPISSVRYRNPMAFNFGTNVSCILRKRPKCSLGISTLAISP